MASSKNPVDSSFASFTAASALQDKTVFVDLTDKPAQAKVVRDGYKVPSVKTNPTIIEQFLSGLETQKPTESPRVINQSITAGIRVGLGTVVDLVLAPKQDVPLGIFSDIHRAVQETSVAALLAKAEQDQLLIKQILKYDRADDIPASEQAAIREKMTTLGMPINDADSETSFDKGFNALRTVLAFK